MRTGTRLAAYVAALALVFGGAWAIGAVAGPSSDADTAPEPGHAQGHGGGHEAAAAAGETPGGLTTTEGGYTMVPATAMLPAGGGEFAFRITGPGGAPVTRFDVEHDKRMHLIVLRRDTTAFQHVHPQMGPDGTWRVPLTMPAGGTYRAFADFVPAGGEATTLGVDLLAPGEFTPVEHQPSRVAQVDGYEVRLDGDLVPGRSSQLTMTVTRGGVPVTDLQPYLAAYGHLVALRGGDLAYLHVHPDGEPGDGRTRPGPTITFFAEVPSAGGYRLFLDFQHEGRVRTAEFTVPTQGQPQQAPAVPQPAPAPDHGGDGHTHG